jgi:hypothetical protein
VFFVYKLFNYYGNVYEGFECKNFNTMTKCNDKIDDNGKKCIWRRKRNNQGMYIAGTHKCRIDTNIGS